MIDQRRLFEELVSFVAGRPDRRGEVHVDCPACGHPARRGKTHFSFSEQGGHCFSCGHSCSLLRLADDLGYRRLATGSLPRRAVLAAHAPKPAQTATDTPRAWQGHPERILRVFEAALDRYRAWWGYKGLDAQSVRRWRLGTGVLPASHCPHRRLIYPVIVAGEIVALRGRQMGCDCAGKWLSAGGSKTVLFGAERLQSGGVVIVCESPVDVMLAAQVAPEYAAVAGTAGAGTWREEWTAAIRRSDPALVYVVYDHDIAGCPTAEQQHAWQAAHPGKPLPRAGGPFVANELLQAGVRNVHLHRWPPGTPEKADLGELLLQGVKGVA